MCAQGSLETSSPTFCVEIEGIERLSTRLLPDEAVDNITAVLLQSYPVGEAFVARLQGEDGGRVTHTVSGEKMAFK